MLRHIGNTKNREKFLELLNPTKALKSSFQNKGDKSNSNIEETDEDINWKEEVTNVVREYDNFRKALLRKKFKDQDESSSRHSKGSVILTSNTGNNNIFGFLSPKAMQGNTPHNFGLMRKKTTMLGKLRSPKF